MVPPPVCIVPFMVIIVEGRVFWIGPGFAPRYVTGPFKLHARDCRIGHWEIIADNLKSVFCDVAIFVMCR